MELRYGTNPHQAPASWEYIDDHDPRPIEVLSGQPGYINLLDAVAAWSLVVQASAAAGSVVAASFKHVSPAGVATAGPVPEWATDIFGWPTTDWSPSASAYARARSVDPRASYGDFVAISHEVDDRCADLLVRLVSDGIVASSFTPGALERLSRKKRGAYLVLRGDAHGQAAVSSEVRELGGIRLVQPSDTSLVRPADELRTICGPPLTTFEWQDAMLAVGAAKFAQSNSVAFSQNGIVLSVGAGQQSRIACTQLAAHKLGVRRALERVDRDALDLSGPTQRRVNTACAAAEAILAVEGPHTALRIAPSDTSRLAFASDGYLPFDDNVVAAAAAGAGIVAAPTGSVRDGEVIAACERLGVTYCQAAHRYFRH